MNRFPCLEAQMLKTLQEAGELRPPTGRLAEEWFWQAAAWLQARGLCIADQAAGVVRQPASAESLLRALLKALEPLSSEWVETYPSAWEIAPHGPVDGEQWGQKVLSLCKEAGAFLETPPPGARPVNDLPSRLRLLLGRWRARETGSSRQCTIDLEEVMEECGVEP